MILSPNPLFQPLIGSQEPTPEVLVPVINIIIIRVNREIARRQHVALGTLGDGGPKTSNKHAHGEVMLRACDCAALYAGDACTNFDRLL